MPLGKKGIHIISEIEFCRPVYGSCKRYVLQEVTVKTTTTNLLYHMLKKAGKKCCYDWLMSVRVFAMAVAEESYDYFVIELSSFQLDGMYEFKADIAILLNITPDHLDRYGYEFQNYIDSKIQGYTKSGQPLIALFTGLKTRLLKRNLKRKNTG